MEFIAFKEKNILHYNFFEANDRSYKDFIIFAFDEFQRKNPDSLWYLDIDNKSLNSYPNFTQKHQICISHQNFKDNIFQFRISCENNVSSLGYRMFLNLLGHADFVTSDINILDNVMLDIKHTTLKGFDCVSKCGWWITDIWRDLHPILDDSDSKNFIENILDHEYTKQMLLMNDLLLKAQKIGELDIFLEQLKNSID
ncbi:effector protein [Campylobacter sp. CCUG 57310]|uniref:effector protein n=1 Tax=Campylobacter sp. CCUG 57310 TaxID=2517362 RepID=UPI00156496F5|nr:effector protein [Campylobacter sp. CCUG 57310]QKF92989.1 hypothetical protein CORI_1831 [Campylobacter sp. CCUG 57310]